MAKSNQPSGNLSIKVLLWIMLLSLSIIFASIVSSYLRYSKTLSDYEWLNHTNKVMKEVIQLKSIVYETESAIREYLIVGNMEARPDLNVNFREAERQWKLVKSMTKDNAEQQILCDSLMNLLQERYIVFSSSMTGKNSGNKELVNAGIIDGNVIMDEFTRVVDQMLENEYKLNAERESATEVGTRYTPLFLLMASVVSAFFIILVYILLLKEYRRGLLLQRKLAQNVRELNQSNQELEQFAYIASHDLQEPLRKMRSFSSILNTKEESSLSDEGKQVLGKINSSAARMQALIDDLLTFSRMLTKPLETEQVDLNAVVEDVKTEFPAEENGRKVAIENEKLPVISGYSTAVHRLFQNLFSNSIKYSKREGDIRIHISSAIVKGDAIPKVIDSDLRRTFHKISVVDNGIGFENEYAERIFTIFQRLHNRNEYSGTGIGLAICKRIVENHEGYIRATSELGVGTTMDIYFPVS